MVVKHKDFVSSVVHSSANCLINSFVHSLIRCRFLVSGARCGCSGLSKITCRGRATSQRITTPGRRKHSIQTVRPYFFLVAQDQVNGACASEVKIES